MRRSLWIIACGATFALLSFGGPGAGPLSRVDGWTHAALVPQSSQGRAVAALVSDVLSYGIGPAAMVAVLIVLIRQRDHVRLAALGLLVLAYGLVGSVLKPAFARPRPLIAEAESFAYPSGHTSASILLAASVLLLGRERWRVGFVIAVGVATGIARVVSGNHWLTDVLGAGAYAAAVVLLILGAEPVKVTAPAAARIT